MRVLFRKVEESGGVMWMKMDPDKENRLNARKFVFCFTNHFLRGTECVREERD